MLLAIKELDFHIQRMSRDFVFGEIVKERGLERTKLDDFNFRSDYTVRFLMELQAITTGESQSYVVEALKALGKAKQHIMRLTREAAEKNPDVTPIVQHLQVIIDRKRKTVEDVKFNLTALFEQLDTLQAKHSFAEDVLQQLTKVIESHYEDTEEDMADLNQAVLHIWQTLDAFRIKNKHLEEVVGTLLRKLDDIVFILKDESELALHDFVYSPELQALPYDVLETIGQNLHLTREATMFENHMGTGDHLTTIQQAKEHKHALVTYGTDPDLDDCREAKANGVDMVAKKGLYKISHNTFDIALCIQDRFTFFIDEKSSYTLDEEMKFHYLFNRSIPKSNAYVIFNIPYFRIPNFMSKIKSMLTIESVYKVDDPIKNVLFICRYKHSDRSHSKTFTKAIHEYDKLPHYSTMTPLTIAGGEVVHPKQFRPYFVDAEDISQAFAYETPTLSIVEDAYRPKEKVVELNRPLQEYKEGHLPAVATIEIVNGVYDLGDIDFPNIYSTKIVQQDVEDEQEEVYKGEKVRVISQKKKNVIVSKILLPTGEIIELLNTK